MYGPRLRTYTAMPAAAACSGWLPRVVRPLPCRRATRATRVISNIMMMLTSTTTVQSGCVEHMNPATSRRTAPVLSRVSREVNAGNASLRCAASHMQQEKYL